MQTKTAIPGLKWDCLQITVTNNCNLECRHCLRGRKFMRKENSLETIKEYLAQFSPDNFDFILLSDFGEPFLRKDIIEILRHVKSEGFHTVEMVSNATLFKARIIETIVEENLLARIFISTEAASKEMFEYIRGTDFDEFLANVTMLADYKTQYDSPYPEIILNAVCMKKNIRELPGIMDLAYELRAGRVFYVHLNAITVDQVRGEYADKICTTDQRLGNDDRELAREIFRQIHEKSLQYNIPYQPPEDYLNDPEPPVSHPAPPSNANGEERKSACSMPYKWVQITEGGNVHPCCQISKNYPLGNINHNSFEEIWNSEKFVKFREDLDHGIAPTHWCETCNVFNGKRF